MSVNGLTITDRHEQRQSQTQLSQLQQQNAELAEMVRVKEGFQREAFAARVTIPRLQAELEAAPGILAAANRDLAEARTALRQCSKDARLAEVARRVFAALRDLDENGVVDSAQLRADVRLAESIEGEPNE